MLAKKDIALFEPLHWEVYRRLAKEYDEGAYGILFKAKGKELHVNFPPKNDDVGGMNVYVYASAAVVYIGSEGCRKEFKASYTPVDPYEEVLGKIQTTAEETLSFITNVFQGNVYFRVERLGKEVLSTKVFYKGDEANAEANEFYISPVERFLMRIFHKRRVTTFTWEGPCEPNA